MDKDLTRAHPKRFLISAPILLAGIFFLSVLIRMIGLHSHTLVGDDFQSLEEIPKLWANNTSILYFALMHVWAKFGSTEAWLRFPAVVFGTMTIIVGYFFGKAAFDRRSGYLMAMLLATSPMAVFYSQQIRFYSLFLMASLLAYTAFDHYWRRRTMISLALLLVSDAICLLSHFFGIFVIAIQLSTVLFLSNVRLRWKVALPLLVWILPIVMIYGLNVGTYNQMYNFLLNIHLTKGQIIPDYYGGPRGIGVGNVGKLLLTIYQFALGNGVYPLTYMIVAPVLAFHGVLMVLGCKQIKKYLFIGVMVVSGILWLFIIFFGVDPLSPKQRGVFSSYLVFLLPIYYLWLCAGTLELRTKIYAMVSCGLIAINIGGLVADRTSSWSLYPAPKFSHLEGLIREGRPNVIFAEGRAMVRLKYHFPECEPILEDVSKLRDLEGIRNGPDKILLVCADYRAEMYGQFNAVLKNVEEHYRLIENLVRYPIFAFLYEKKQRASLATRFVQPQEVMGLEFSDLDLPVRLTFKGETTFLTTAVLVSAGKKASFEANGAPNRGKVVLLSHLICDEGIPYGSKVGRLVIWANGVRLDLPIVKGRHTMSWNDSLSKPRTSSQVAIPVYSWRKRVHFLGQRYYPGAYKDFQARIYAGLFTLPEPLTIERIEIEVDVPKARLYVWAVF